MTFITSQPLPLSQKNVIPQLPTPSHAIVTLTSPETTPSCLTKTMSHNDNKIPTSSPLQKQREPLRFSFKGYTLWLEIEECSNDFQTAISRAADDLGFLPVPQPHVTTIYGMDHVSEAEVLDMFEVAKKEIRRWPDLRPIGIMTDVEMDGVDGGSMDMVWSEISYGSSPAHQGLIDTLHSIFEIEPNPRPWRPHASFAYDNPEDSPLTLSYTIGLVSEMPTLLSRTRKVVGMSLWSTWGTMGEWKCLDRVTFEG